MYSLRSILLLTFVLISGCRINVDVVGDGVVTATGGGYHCNENEPITDPDCFNDYTAAGSETLIATPSHGYVFKKWEVNEGEEYCEVEPSLNKCTIGIAASHIGNVLNVKAIFEKRRAPVTAASYTYNALGQRITKTVGGTTTIFQYDLQGRLIGEFDSAGQPVVQHVHMDDMPIAQIRSVTGGTFETDYIHTDHLGTPTLITNSNQEPVAGIEATPFGDAYIDLQNVPYSLRMPGQYKDEETSLHYNYFRDYDPAHGRYVQSDPIGLHAGTNTYGYVGGNPVSYTDSYGLAPWVMPALVRGGAGIAGRFGVPNAARRLAEAVGGGLAGCLLVGVCSTSDEPTGEVPEGQSCPVDLPDLVPDFDFNDPTQPPVGADGETWPWKGQQPQGGDKGGYKNPNGPESIHPDLDHGGDIGPHWDFNDRRGPGFRIDPDGVITPK